uniref:Iron-binding zinc finger CDGSH type domain-containing protein n=1 Tax=Ditylum brightwellii TaxID=49249 RepID=A0A6U3VYZ3_9STRA|mmetsp:Transcript_9714/g.14480  ORF Transcript_9714/g.14480 Transcript_9714/m.14480 type:complete len:102 (+) Transcript_9714:58-363(+)
MKLSLVAPLLISQAAAFTFVAQPQRLQTKLYDEAPGKINFKIDQESAKVVNQEKLGAGDKKVYCRCWQSGTFPLCDASHVKHNEATGDNVGPLIVAVAKEE